ncbi:MULTISPECIES: hypothetical protein [unclassified Xanthobacter]|uniref:hypothetical protein n=1 Tax=unclassified Xanthobacter TaxID=2623496 RepID=UPI001EE02893|nr:MULTISPECIES: hypothetical protein [unclassified Xanthobacter]
MFGISPIGWVHTLGSLPAIPLAAWMLARHGRIVPQSRAGSGYLVAMTIGALSAYAVAKAPVSAAIATLTLLALAVGYGISRLESPGRLLSALQTFSLSFSVLLLMVPTVTETLTRVPDGHPWAASPAAPLVLGAQGTVLALFLIGVAAQMVSLFRRAT